MSRKVIELVQVLVDRIEKNGYQQRSREENAFDLNKRLTEAEGWVAHWKQARQEAHEAGELMKAEIETLRQQLANAQQELSEQSMVINVEQQQDAAAWQQQVDSANAEVSYLRARLDEERSVSARLRQQLDAAQVTILAQKAGNQYLRLLADKVRAIVSSEDIASSKCEFIAEALDDLDDGTIEPTPCPKCERLQAFVNLSRRLLGGTVRYADVNRLRAALAELDAGTEPAPVAEPIDAEGGA